VLLVQKRQQVKRVEMIMSHLEHRAGIDALQSQITQAHASLTARQSELARAETTVRDCEFKLQALINSPAVKEGSLDEFVPQERPTCNYLQVSAPDVLCVALKSRPDINETMKQIKAAQIRLDVSEKDLLPALNFVIQSYVSGLRGNRDIGGSYQDQFSAGNPSYTTGLIYEMPFGNRAANAQHLRRRLELRQLTQQLQAIMARLAAEVDAAVQDLQASYTEMQGKFVWMKAAQKETEYLHRRWEVMSGEDQSASIILRELLDAQERLAVAEQEFAYRQVNYTLARYRLEMVAGTLMHTERISATRTDVNGMPEMKLEKAPLFQTPAPQENNPRPDGISARQESAPPKTHK
jgi:outer membrane protein TolC